MILQPSRREDDGEKVVVFEVEQVVETGRRVGLHHGDGSAGEEQQLPLLLLLLLLRFAMPEEAAPRGITVAVRLYGVGQE